MNKVGIINGIDFDDRLNKMQGYLHRKIKPEPPPIKDVSHIPYFLRILQDMEIDMENKIEAMRPAVEQLRRVREAIKALKGK